MNIALVCWEFGGAQRPRSLAEGLTAAGHHVTFYTSEIATGDPGYDVVTIAFTRAGTRMRAAVGIEPDVNLAAAARARGRFAARVVSLAARTFETLTQFPDKYRAWIPAVREWLRANPGALDNTDVVIASTPPPSALIVGQMLAEAAGAALVYDFRDLWTDNPSYPYGPVRRTIDRISERRLMASPIAAATATQSLADTLVTRNPGMPVRAVYTGVDPRPWLGLPARARDGRLVFGHFGVWYPGKRSIRPLLESLRRLADSGVVDLSRVSVQLWGNGADDQTWDAVRDLRMAAVVEDRGWADPTEVPGALALVDVALLLAWPEDTISVPLKIHGYVASGKPILVLGASQDSEMAAVLRGRPGITLVLTQDDVDEAVTGYWRDASGNEPHTWTPTERPLAATPSTMAAEFLQLLDTAGVPDVPGGMVSDA